MVTSINSAQISPDSTDLNHERTIGQLIGPAFSIPSEENLHRAFNIAKTMEDVTMQMFMLSNIGNAYLKLFSEQGCQQAYEVALYKQKRKGEVRELLNNIVCVCLKLKTEPSLFLAMTIFKTFPAEMGGSVYKNQLYSFIEMKQDLSPQPQSVDVNELCTKVENVLIKRGEQNVILAYQAKDLAEKRKFQQSIEIANSIPHTIERDGTIAAIFEKFCSYGDHESLGFALEIAKNELNYCDNYIYSIIETCRKKENKAFALQAANAMRNPVLKEKVIRKINLWKV